MMSRESRAGDRTTGREGFILAAVLWMLLALATAASAASIYVTQSARSLTFHDEAVTIEPLVAAGVELAAYRILTDHGTRGPTRKRFQFAMSGATIAVEYVSETARVDLNFAPTAMIASLFVGLGAPASAAAEHAERVVGWRSRAKAAGQADEDVLYAAAGLPYPPRKGAFNHPDELWLVAGLPSWLVESAMAFVTVYSGTGEINVYDAPAQVLAALPGMSPLRLRDFLNRRDSLRPGPIADMLGADAQGATAGRSDAYRVRVRVTSRQGRRQASEIVIMLSGGDAPDPYRVLSWRAGLDPQPEQSSGVGQGR